MTDPDRLWMPAARQAMAAWTDPAECLEALASLGDPERHHDMRPETRGKLAQAMRRSVAGHLRAIRQDGAADWREEARAWLAVAREARRVAHAWGGHAQPEAPFAFPDLGS